MSHQGKREHWSEGRGWSLRIGPLFKGEIVYGYRRYHYGYACTLNGADLGFFPRVEDARHRVEWEIWNQLRVSAEGLKLLFEQSKFAQIGVSL